MIKESVDIAPLTSVVAAKYSPISGLITDNNYDAYTKRAGGAAGGSGTGSSSASPTPFTDPNAPPAPPTGPPAGAAASITGVGAYTPDWAKLISGDAGLQAAQGALTAGHGADLASRNAAIQQAYIQFGGNIDAASLAQKLGLTEADVQSAIDPRTQQLAKEGTTAGLTTEARLGQANQDAINKIKIELNKRGMLYSGDTGYQLDQQNTSFRQAEYDATQKMLGYLQQYQEGYLSAERQRQSDLATAYSSAADRAYNNNHSTPGVTATFSYTDENGKPVYRTPDGKVYNADGSPYAPMPADNPTIPRPKPIDYTPPVQNIGRGMGYE